MTAVPRIDRDDDVPARPVGLRGALDRHEIAAAMQVDDEAVTVFRVGTGREAARADFGVEVQHDAQIAVGPNGAAYRSHSADAIGQVRERLRHPAVGQVNDQPVWPAQREYAVDGRLAQVDEHDPCLVVFGPDANIFYRGTSQRRRNVDKQQHDRCQAQSGHFS